MTMASRTSVMAPLIEADLTVMYASYEAVLDLLGDYTPPPSQYAKAAAEALGAPAIVGKTPGGEALIIATDVQYPSREHVDALRQAISAGDGHISDQVRDDLVALSKSISQLIWVRNRALRDLRPVEGQDSTR